MRIEDAEVSIKMTIAANRKSFKVEVNSDIEMSDSEIILAIEVWLRDNLMQGVWAEASGDH